MTSAPDLEALARQLEASADYRVLRRVPEPVIAAEQQTCYRVGVVLDCETTGLDPANSDIVELAMVAFAYDEAGPVQVLRTFSGLHEPGTALSEEVKRLTGLSDADLAGQRIDDAQVEAFLEGVVFVVAHNAAFDRPFVEKRWPAFERLGWGCSLTQVSWKEEGLGAANLKALLAEAGFFHDGHRALNDCLATLHLLGRALPVSGRTPLATILERSRMHGARVWAIDSPFPVKDDLKRRGYRWSDGFDGSPRGWSIEVTHVDLPAEIAWLERDIYRGPSKTTAVPITAWERFSARAGRARSTEVKDGASHEQH